MGICIFVDMQIGSRTLKIAGLSLLLKLLHNYCRLWRPGGILRQWRAPQNFIEFQWDVCRPTTSTITTTTPPPPSRLITNHHHHQPPVMFVTNFNENPTRFFPSPLWIRKYITSPQSIIIIWMILAIEFQANSQSIAHKFEMQLHPASSGEFGCNYIKYSAYFNLRKKCCHCDKVMIWPMG